MFAECDLSTWERGELTMVGREQHANHYFIADDRIPSIRGDLGGALVSTLGIR